MNYYGNRQNKTLMLSVKQQQTLQTGKPLGIKFLIGKLVRGIIVRKLEPFGMVRKREPIQRE